MPEQKHFQKWFNVVDQDTEYLVNCLAEILDDLGHAALVKALPWRENSIGGDREAIRQKILIMLERLWRTGEMYLEKRAEGLKRLHPRQIQLLSA